MRRRGGVEEEEEYSGDVNNSSELLSKNSSELSSKMRFGIFREQSECTFEGFVREHRSLSLSRCSFSLHLSSYVTSIHTHTHIKQVR